MQLLIILTVLSIACFALPYDSENSSCQRCDCLSIKDCLSVEGKIQDSSVCDCPLVQCCYSQESSTTESTSSSESDHTPNTPTTTTPSESESSTTSTQTSTEESSTASETTSSLVNESSEESQGYEEKEYGCNNFTCATEEECYDMDGVEGTNRDDCPEPYMKCCMPNQ